MHNIDKDLSDISGGMIGQVGLILVLGATVVTVLGALYVLILFSLSNRCPPFEFFFYLVAPHLHLPRLSRCIDETP